MSAETTREFEALEAQAGKLLKLFTSKGYEAVAPALIQPADIYLDVIGEALRARTYVFQDPNGVELCLRPDLTVPTCLLHLGRGSHEGKIQRYCYNGTAFRFQAVDTDLAHPREFRQLGIESFGGDDPEKIEAGVVALIVEGLAGAGLDAFALRIGDLGILKSVLAAADMPDRWRHRLLLNFWRPQLFLAELDRLAAAPAAAADALPEQLRVSMDGCKAAEAPKIVGRYLESQGIELIGSRTLQDIADNIQILIADAKSPPLKPETVGLIRKYMGVRANAKAAGARLKDLMREHGINITEALEVYQRRLSLFQEAGVDVSKAQFSAQFGRGLEYYSGFVFEITTSELGESSPVAGGGRYDGLLRACGAQNRVPAAGAAIHTERLLYAVNQQAKPSEDD